MRDSSARLGPFSISFLSQPFDVLRRLFISAHGLPVVISPVQECPVYPLPKAWLMGACLILREQIQYLLDLLRCFIFLQFSPSPCSRRKSPEPE